VAANFLSPPYTASPRLLTPKPSAPACPLCSSPASHKHTNTAHNAHNAHNEASDRLVLESTTSKPLIRHLSTPVISSSYSDLPPTHNPPTPTGKPPCPPPPTTPPRCPPSSKLCAPKVSSNPPRPAQAKTWSLPMTWTPYTRGSTASCKPFPRISSTATPSKPPPWASSSKQPSMQG